MVNLSVLYKYRPQHEHKSYYSEMMGQGWCMHIFSSIPAVPIVVYLFILLVAFFPSP